MSIATFSTLSSFADWLRENDEHADHHLGLIARIDAIEGGTSDVNADVRNQLAEKVDRWRYQHLNEHEDDWSATNEAFVDALDETARRLADRWPHAPRATRHAINDPAFDPPGLDEALAGLRKNSPLDELSQRAELLTRQHFAENVNANRWPMLLYAPLYVSSHCVNHCTYCGFRYPEDISRKHLTVDEADRQAAWLYERGFRHLLIVGGDFPSQTNANYFAEIAAALARRGIEPAVEIAAQTVGDYRTLAAAGVCGVTLYQETYARNLYHRYHLRGPKASYHWRLEAHDRAAEAGLARLGLGVLLGLADPLADLQSLARHGTYLQRRFPHVRLAFSLPRIKEAPQDFQIPFPVDDEQLIRMYCALRLAFPDAMLVLSTRESPAIREQLAKICITQMSAGSSTVPGGYDDSEETGGAQFPVVDQRPAAEIAAWLEAEGFSIRWSSNPT